MLIHQSKQSKTTAVNIYQQKRYVWVPTVENNTMFKNYYHVNNILKSIDVNYSKVVCISIIKNYRNRRTKRLFVKDVMIMKGRGILYWRSFYRCHKKSPNGQKKLAFAEWWSTWKFFRWSCFENICCVMNRRRDSDKY